MTYVKYINTRVHTSYAAYLVGIESLGYVRLKVERTKRHLALFRLLLRRRLLRIKLIERIVHRLL